MTMNIAARPPAATRGFSLLEVILAAVILFVIIGLSATILNGGNKLLNSVSIRSQSEVSAANVADQIATRIRNGFMSSLRDPTGAFIADGGGSTTGFSVRLFDRFEGGPLAGETVSFTLGRGETNVVDGKDDDKDNLVDERSIVLRRWKDPTPPGASLHNLATDPLGIPLNPLAPSQTAELSNIVESLTVSRVGKCLTITVVALKYEATYKQVLRTTSTVQVTLKN
jgi:hypothetical protein